MNSTQIWALVLTVAIISYWAGYAKVHSKEKSNLESISILYALIIHAAMIVFILGSFFLHLANP